MPEQTLGTKRTPRRRQHRRQGPLRSWPLTLPEQTQLQESIHERTWDSRERIIFALWDSPYPWHKKAAGKMATCCQGASFYVDPRHERVRPWVSRCKHRLCPNCGTVRSAKITAQIDVAIMKMTKPRFLVLTVKSKTTPLAEQLAGLRRSFARLRRKAAWIRNVSGGVYTVELTRNEETRLWHPHIHIIYDGEYFPQRLLRRLWHDVTDGAEVVWIAAVTDRAGAASELAKYIGKPQRVSTWPAPAIREYSMATNAARMLGAFGTCYGTPVEDRDPLPADSPDTYTVRISTLVYRAAFGMATPARLAIAIAERWPQFASYIHHRAPQLEPPIDQANKLRILMAVTRDGPRAPPIGADNRSPGPTTVRPGQTTDPEKLDRRILQLFCVYRAEEAANEYYLADRSRSQG